MGTFDECVTHNLLGQKYEADGKIDKAIKLYEQNVSEYFEGSHPYYRLADIYHKNKQVNDETRILRRAICVFENIVNPKRVDRNRKLAYFKQRLKNLNDERSNINALN